MIVLAALDFPTSEGWTRNSVLQRLDAAGFRVLRTELLAPKGKAARTGVVRAHLLSPSLLRPGTERQVHTTRGVRAHIGVVDGGGPAPASRSTRRERVAVLRTLAGELAGEGWERFAGLLRGVAAGLEQGGAT